MRTRLLEAAVDSLVELGYAGTTTQGIARRAGVSRGAQLHHFPTKESLVVAAVEYLVDKRMAEILAAEVDTDRGIDVLADAFSGPLFYAALELWVAARTDSALFEAMVPLERKVTEALRQGSAEVFGDRYDADTIEIGIELVRGLAVSALFRTPEADRSLRARLLPAWESKVKKS
ncbi:TetR family transcriptional regulator [Rhodococcus oxybenzonivorans]|uniref:TetR family transcriptional regulator n=1 Tax=Rhodococcus oxybenzonivorans TaxID=1990687 RepID=A0A2S2C317_9NOCA|nr:MULTISPECIES: TetR/AcrR family transcriptional regulator [Rhodococcus]AWK75307.1 TetR family transcriptional regulator [Rhodococcus oxybenzonivorans]QTJ69754.1 TetR/AcrR family transcriptional regulator [Rhodococcus sp. ZPP]